MSAPILSDILDFEGAGKLKLTGDVEVAAGVTRIVVGVLECERNTRIFVNSPFLLIRAAALQCPDLQILWREPAPVAQPAKAADGAAGNAGAHGSNMSDPRHGQPGQSGGSGNSGAHGADGLAAPSVALGYSRRWTLYPTVGWNVDNSGDPVPLPDPPAPLTLPDKPPVPDALLTQLEWFEPHQSFGQVKFSLTGQEGGAGQDAGDGGLGGDGGRGAEAVYHVSSAAASPWGAAGGAAGAGGDGGMGGQGGSGGAGAPIFCLMEFASNFRAPHVGLVQPLMHNVGGPPGFPGRGGEGDDAGNPGRGGADVNSYGDRQVAATGARGEAGTDGLSGEPGQQGPMGGTVIRSFAARTQILVPHDGFPYGPNASGYLRDVIAEEFHQFGV